jgi:hypothetical protein
MKTPKLLKKTEELLSAKRSKQRKKVDSLKELLDKLKKKKRKLKDKLEAESDQDDQKRLRKELEVIRAQRHKGLKLLKDLKK